MVPGKAWGRRTVGSVWAILKQTLSEWMDDKCPRLGAAVSFYTTFSLSPLLVIVVAIAGLVFGPDAARGQIRDQIQGLVGKEGATLIETMLAGAYKPGSGALATILGLLTLLLGATGVFGELQDSLNTIWDVPPRPGIGIVAMLRSRFLSFTTVLGTGFLLLVSLVLSAVIAALGTYFQGLLPGLGSLLHVMNFLLSFAVTALLFGMIFKVLPDAEISWRSIWLGVAVTALLFTAGKFLIGLYLGQSSVSSVYGAAGSLAILLLWIYYSAQILFLGAEFTKVYDRRLRTGSVERPRRGEPCPEPEKA